MHKSIHELGIPESRNTYVVNEYVCVYVLWPIFVNLFISKWGSVFWLTSQNHVKVTEVSLHFEGGLIVMQELTQVELKVEQKKNKTMNHLEKILENFAWVTLKGTESIFGGAGPVNLFSPN